MKRKDRFLAALELQVPDRVPMFDYLFQQALFEALIGHRPERSNARDAVECALALDHDKKPGLLVTVFAGQELDATEKAREYFVGYPPSSPSVALMKDGDLVYMMERNQIEGHTPHEIAEELKEAFDRHC